MVTSFIFTIVTIIDGSVLTEQIFSWPGMGQLLLQSVLEEDIPVAMATFSFVGVFTDRKIYSQNKDKFNEWILNN